MYILTDGKNYVIDDPIHPGRVMYSTSPVNAKKFTFKQARALLNNKSKKLSWIRSFNMVDDSSGEEVQEQEVKSKSNKGVFVGKNDIDFDISILDQITREANSLLGIAGWSMNQLNTYQNLLAAGLSKYDSAISDIVHVLEEYNEKHDGKKPQAHKIAKLGYMLTDVRIIHSRIKHITVDYNTIYLGDFTNYEDAVVARKEAEIKYGFTCDDIVAPYDNAS